jgi:flagellin
MVVYMNSEGDQGVVASIHKALLLSALTLNASTLKAETFSSGDQSTVYRLANESVDGTGAGAVISLGAISVGVFSQALQNIATLRAENGASMSQLEYGYDNLITQKNNLATGRGRIMDVDMASESTRLSKYNILVQASTSMLAQANSLSEISLVLMR